jgi:hypothetical protein
LHGNLLGQAVHSATVITTTATAAAAAVVNTLRSVKKPVSELGWLVLTCAAADGGQSPPLSFTSRAPPHTGASKVRVCILGILANLIVSCWYCSRDGYVFMSAAKSADVHGRGMLQGCRAAGALLSAEWQVLSREGCKAAEVLILIKYRAKFPARFAAGN